MPHTSPYFNSVWPGQTAEQGLVDDLVREQIKIYGLDVLYMPRRHLNLDLLLHESSKVAFEMAMPIPMYLKTVDGFDNGMEVLSKFGVFSVSPGLNIENNKFIKQSWISHSTYSMRQQEKETEKCLTKWSV